MRDPRHSRLAEVLVGYSTGVKPGDLVCVASDPAGMPLVEEVFSAVLRAGGHPFWHPRSESLQQVLLEEGSREQLAHVSALELERVRRMDVYIGIWAETNTRAASRVDPARLALFESARKPVMSLLLERAARGELRWCGTQFPTQASAQDAEMSLRQYEDFVYGAGMLDRPDPAAAWREVHERQDRLRAFLQGKREVRFRAPARPGDDGTDLRVDVSAATWINCAGRENFPDGEVFAGPTGVDGHVSFTFPAVYNGREVLGARLAFKGGRVVDASATKNEAYLIQMLEQDAGARTLGEIAIGTNYAIREFTRNTLFDEKIGGTFHAAVGAGYPESGNSNQSGLHWDMVCDLREGGTIEADGEVFSRDGRFVDARMPRPAGG